MEFWPLLYLKLFPSLGGAVFVLGVTILAASTIYYICSLTNSSIVYGSAIDFFCRMGMSNGFLLILIGAVGIKLPAVVVLCMVAFLALMDYIFFDIWKQDGR